MFRLPRCSSKVARIGGSLPPDHRFDGTPARTPFIQSRGLRRSRPHHERHVGSGQGTWKSRRRSEPAPRVLRTRDADSASSSCAPSGRGCGHGEVRCRRARDLARAGNGSPRRGAPRSRRSDRFVFIERFTSFARLRPRRKARRPFANASGSRARTWSRFVRPASARNHFTIQWVAS